MMRMIDKKQQTLHVECRQQCPPKHEKCRLFVFCCNKCVFVYCSTAIYRICPDLECLCAIVQKFEMGNAPTVCQYCFANDIDNPEFPWCESCLDAIDSRNSQYQLQERIRLSRLGIEWKDCSDCVIYAPHDVYGKNQKKFCHRCCDCNTDQVHIPQYALDVISRIPSMACKDVQTLIKNYLVVDKFAAIPPIAAEVHTTKITSPNVVDIIDIPLSFPVKRKRRNRHGRRSRRQGSFPQC